MTKRITFNVEPQHAKALGMFIYNLEPNNVNKFTTEEDGLLNVYLDNMEVICSYRTGLITIYENI